MKNFDEVIEEYREEFLDDLNELLSIRSVSAEGDKIPQQALKWMLDKAESFGLKTKNIDNIAGHAEFGEGEKICGVLTHLDVVPAKAEDWSCEPFALTRKNGRMYGRGVADDKGSALCALYCLRALKECGITGNRVRVIFGTSEEIGMKDMETYFSKEPVPDMSFTPDSEYGICKGEKGIYHLELSDPTVNNVLLLKFEAGSANNVVPDSAYALVNGWGWVPCDVHAIPGEFDINYTKEGVEITSKGKAAHACEPHKGFNAAAALADIVTESAGYESVGNLIYFIDCCIGDETNGSSLGVSMRDDESGELTLTLSRVSVSEDESKAVLDIRYPVTANGEDVLKQIRKKAGEWGLEVKVIDEEKPLFLDENSDVVKILSKAYENVMGTAPELYTTGGGTYARTLGGKGVAFGPVFPDDDSRMHNTDESLDEEKFFKHFRICLEAMCEMMKF